jgi:ribosomal protein L35
MRRKRMSSHLRRKKPKKVRRKFMGKILLDPTNVNRIQRLMPYDA